MNNNTMVVVCGYAGDAHQIRNLMPYYLHHRCPVLILSPSDSPITPQQLPIRRELGFLTGGKRAYTGQESLDRQIEHMRLMLRCPAEYKFFLAHDSDSVVLSQELPSYIYNEPDVLWSNEVSDAMHDPHRPADYSYPHLAFQPPYFMSRGVIERLLSVAPAVKADPHTPFIDWAMMAWAVKAGIPHKNFIEGASCPTTPGYGIDTMKELVERHGRYFVHSVKTPEALKTLVWARVAFKNRFRKG
jgi:hypothetical protein